MVGGDFRLQARKTTIALCYGFVSVRRLSIYLFLSFAVLATGWERDNNELHRPYLRTNRYCKRTFQLEFIGEWGAGPNGRWGIILKVYLHEMKMGSCEDDSTIQSADVLGIQQTHSLTCMWRRWIKNSKENIWSFFFSVFVTKPLQLKTRPRRRRRGWKKGVFIRRQFLPPSLHLYNWHLGLAGRPRPTAYSNSALGRSVIAAVGGIEAGRQTSLACESLC